MGSHTHTYLWSYGMTRTHKEVADILLRLRMKERPRRVALDGSDAWVAVVTKHRMETMNTLRHSRMTDDEYKMERWRLTQEWSRQDARIAEVNGK